VYHNLKENVFTIKLKGLLFAKLAPGGGFVKSDLEALKNYASNIKHAVCITGLSFEGVLWKFLQ